MINRKKASLIPVRIGALLVSSGLLRADHMAEALHFARQSGKKLGEVLLAHRLITPNELNCALELQHLIKEGSITVEMGTEAMRLAHSKQLGFAEVLQELGWSQQKNISSNDLAAILLEAGVITKPQLDQATWNAAKNGLPLGRNLVLTGAISPSILGATLTVLLLLRDKRTDIPSAITALRKACELRCPIEETLPVAPSSECNHVRVGELLSQAGLVSESDAMIAVENSLLNQRSIGQLLLEYGMISPLVLDATLKLQNLVERQHVARGQAAELLRLVATENVGLEHFLNQMSSLKSKVLDLLLASGIITRNMVSAALGHSGGEETDIVRALFSTGAMTNEMFRAAVRCVYTISIGSYTREEAIAWLRHSFAPQELAVATA